MEHISVVGLDITGEWDCVIGVLVFLANSAFWDVVGETCFSCREDTFTTFELLSLELFSLALIGEADLINLGDEMTLFSNRTVVGELLLPEGDGTETGDMLLAGDETEAGDPLNDGLETEVEILLDEGDETVGVMATTGETRPFSRLPASGSFLALFVDNINLFSCSEGGVAELTLMIGTGSIGISAEVDDSEVGL